VSERDRFGADAHRYLDGAPHGDLAPEERREADRLLGAVQAWTEGLEPPTAALDDAVMARIRAKAPRRADRGWRWLVRPQPIRLRPVWVPLAAAAALAFWMLAKPEVGPGPTLATDGAATTVDTVFVRFQLIAPDAQVVSLAGSFSDWTSDAYPMTQEDGGVWSITLPLPVGEHQYQFVIDGERWIPDPRSHALVDDGFGGTNSVVIVGPRGVVQS
jgi:hypothetical protein